MDKATNAMIAEEPRPMPVSVDAKRFFDGLKKKQLYPIDPERLETVKRLWREVPGAGLGGCSKALREADGDYDKARGIAERIANEPKVL